MRHLADAADRGGHFAARGYQNRFIRLFHGIYGPNLETVVLGLKYALYHLGLIASPLTYSQDIGALTSPVKQRIEDTLNDFKEDLDESVTFILGFIIYFYLWS